MVTHDVSNWPRHELRLAFYDFSLRGEGDEATVAAVIEAWRRLGALSDEEADHWHDALAWRSSGEFLPGWTVPHWLRQKGLVPSETDEAAFIAWRAFRREHAHAA